MNTIYDGTFVIGQTSAMNFQAGPGITITQPSEGTVRIANDETVLWEGTMSASGVSAAYSEPALNFEYLRFIGSTNDSPPTNAFIIETPTYPISASTYGVTYGSTMFAANWGLKAISMKSSDTEFTKYVEREMSYTNTAWSNYECHYNIYKVIGINRKEV